MRGPLRRSKKRITETPELKWSVSSIAPDVLPPEGPKAVSEAITHIIDRRIQETQFVALRGTLKADKPDAKLPGKTKPGPDSEEELSWSAFRREYPNGHGRDSLKEIHFRVAKRMMKDHRKKITPRTLARHGITKKGIARKANLS